jgi:hypothetical protein
MKSWNRGTLQEISNIYKEGKMKKTTSTGVFHLPNGMWGFRYACWVDVKHRDIKRTKDENGNPLNTKLIR